MSTPARSAVSCGFWLTPPKMVVTVRPAVRASGSTTAITWLRQLAGRCEDEAAGAAGRVDVPDARGA